MTKIGSVGVVCFGKCIGNWWRESIIGGRCVPSESVSLGKPVCVSCVALECLIICKLDFLFRRSNSTGVRGCLSVAQ